MRYHNKSMRIAVAGLGFMGSTHLKALKNIPSATLAAVVSSDERKLAGDLSAIQGNIGGPGEKFDFSNIARYTTLDAALADPNIDAIDLCLPTDLHASATIRALEAGKHVLIEKPMALTAAECDAMLAAAERTGRVLMVAQVLRFFPMYTALADQLRSGALGPVRSALFRRRCAAPAWSKWLTDRDRGGGGVYDLLIHDIDMCLHLFGEPQAISATGFEDLPQGIDILDAWLHYDSIEGAVTVTGGWHHRKAYPFSMEYTVITHGGTLDFSSAGRPPKLYLPDGSEQELTQSAKDGFEAELEHFVACAAAGKQSEICPPHQSAAAARLALALVEARKEKGAKIAWR